MREIMMLAGLLALMFVLAALTVFAIFARALQMVTRMNRNQLPVEPPSADRESSALRTVQAEERIRKDAIERGADELMAASAAAGTPISRSRARKDAEQMLSNFPDLGGAR